MQVMLTQDVTNLGRIGDVVEVKNGYARNFLIPQSLAVPATKGALKQAEQIRAAATKRRARDLQTAQGLANAISALELRFERKVGERGRLYGSVTTTDIAEGIEAKLGQEFDKRKIELSEPIKVLGNYDVVINIYPEVTATVKVMVVGDNGETAADYQDEGAGEEAESSSEQPSADY